MKISKKMQKIIDFIDENPPSVWGSDGGIVWESISDIIEKKCPNQTRWNNKFLEKVDDKITELFDQYVPIINYKSDIEDRFYNKGITGIEVPIHPEAKINTNWFINDVEELFPTIQQACPKFTKSDLELVKQKIRSIYKKNLR